MKNRILKSIFFSVTAAVISISVFMLFMQYRAFDSAVTLEIKTEAGYLTHALNESDDKAAFLSGLKTDNRLTLIAGDGSVLYDSMVSAEQMENHSERSEFIEAMQNGQGEARRYSSTLSEETVYYALRTDDGNVLRISYTKDSVFRLLAKSVSPLLVALAVMLLITERLSKRLTKQILLPIEKIDFDSPLENDSYSELSPFLSRMQMQKETIDEKIRQLSTKQREFEVLVSNMSEAMVLLDTKGKIVTLNTSARRLFNIKTGEAEGEHYYYLCRQPSFDSAVNAAFNGRHREEMLELNKRAYRLLANPIFAGGDYCGVVVLLIDITDEFAAEKTRREFSANVTHELKTPLTSISGYAELIKDGISDEADNAEFAGRIYDEAQRLIALIDDILRLSELDEGSFDEKTESVELHSLCEDIVKRLTPLAAQKNVNIMLEGEPVSVRGIKKLLDELIYNLVENAVKYNNENGKVDISIGTDEQGRNSFLRVSDNGIGIPPEDIPHIFERFYRADKSHSKAVGGTGLGLSIVKHIAAIHGAALDVESSQKDGTRITVMFSE